MMINTVSVSVFFFFFDSLPLINLIPFSSTESVLVKLATKLSLSSCLYFYGAIVHIKSFSLQSCKLPIANAVSC